MLLAFEGWPCAAKAIARSKPGTWKRTGTILRGYPIYNPRMHRRDFLRAGLASLALPALPFQSEKSGLKITGVRLVSTRPKRPVPHYEPAAGSWSTGGVEVA